MRLYTKLTIAVLFAATSLNAYAYLDPSTGSIIVQGLLAGIFATIGILRAYWHRLKKIIFFWKKENKD